MQKSLLTNLRHVPFCSMLLLALFSFSQETLATDTALLSLETPATNALLMDATTGTVLFEKHADAFMHPSSMTKILTAYVVFKKIREGKLKLTDMLTVSEAAQSREGSRTFLVAGSRVTVEDLLRGMIVQSGNDACAVLAEALSGNERAFADEMNKVAHEMGASQVHCTNASGLPDERHQMTARDLSIISMRLIQDFPEEYKIFSEKEFTHNNITQGNRNPLLYKNMGADGIKTGKTDVAGYGMVASVIQGDRRLILVINGLTSVNERSREAQRLIDWGMQEYDNVVIANAEQVIDTADVAGGVAESVGLRCLQDIVITVPRDHKMQIKAETIYMGPFKAPVHAGQPMAKLAIKVPSKPDYMYDLFPAHDVQKAGFVKRIKDSLYRLILGGGTQSAAGHHPASSKPFPPAAPLPQAGQPSNQPLKQKSP